MPEGITSAPSAPARSEQPTASAHLTISLRPDIRAQLDAKVPSSYAGTLVTALSQVAAAALLGVIAPTLTVTAAVGAGFPPGWTVLLP